MASDRIPEIIVEVMQTLSGKKFIRIRSKDWLTDFFRTNKPAPSANPDEPLTVEQQCENLNGSIQRDRTAVNNGDVPPYFILKRYLDQGYMVGRKKLRKTDVDF